MRASCWSNRKCSSLIYLRDLQIGVTGLYTFLSAFPSKFDSTEIIIFLFLSLLISTRFHFPDTLIILIKGTNSNWFFFHLL